MVLQFTVRGNTSEGGFRFGRIVFVVSEGQPSKRDMKLRAAGWTRNHLKIIIILGLGSDFFFFNFYHLFPKKEGI